MLVLLYHYVYLGPPAASAGILVRLQRSFGLGWAGVDLFFVLSGFLIGGLLLDARASRQYFKTFYARRFFRIIPLYYLWIAVYFVLVLTPLNVFLKPLGDIREAWSTVPTYLLFLQNMTKNLHSTFGTAWLGHLWSLAVEEQFYLLVPLAVRFLPRKSLVGLLSGIVVAAPIARTIVFHYLSATHVVQYMLTPCRADALAMGVLLAVFWRDERWKARFSHFRIPFVGVTLLTLAITIYLVCTDPSASSFSMSLFGFSSIDIFFACLLAIVLFWPKGFFASVCRWPLLIQMGRLSYCIYIIHQTVNLACHRALLHAMPQFTNWKGGMVTLLSAGLTFLIASLSWRFFEEPLLRRGHAFKY
ncbi:MAG: acyltransferase family protein [Candidatus Acidiferrales bacterium]